MVNPKDKEVLKARSRRLTDWDYKMICEWLSEPENKDTVFGSDKKTPIGKSMPSKNKAFGKLAEYINEHRSHKSAPIPTDGKAMGQRFRAYLTKYNETKKASQGTGFGVDDPDFQRGIKTIDKLLEEMCPCYAMMDAIFGKQPNIGIPIIRMTTQQGEPNVSAGSTSSGGSDDLLNMDDEVDKHGGNTEPSQRIGVDDDFGLDDLFGNPMSAQRVHGRDWSPRTSIHEQTDEVVADAPTADQGDTCILDKSPEADGRKDKDTSAKRGRDKDTEDESNNAGSKKTGKGSKGSFSQQFEQSMEVLCASRDKLTDVVIADRRDSTAWQKEQAERELSFRMAMEERTKSQYDMELSCREKDLEFRKSLEINRLEWEKAKHLAELRDRELMRNNEWRKEILEQFGRTKDDRLLSLLKHDLTVDGPTGPT